MSEQKQVLGNYAVVPPQWVGDDGPVGTLFLSYGVKELSPSLLLDFRSHAIPERLWNSVVGYDDCDLME